MPRSARMPSHASAGGTAARTGQRSCNDAAAAMLSPWKGDAGPRLIPSNIYEDRALDATDFAQGLVEGVLARKGRDLSQDHRRRRRAGADRGREPQHLVPVLLDK